MRLVMSNVLIIAAHPDDEVLGCGIAIQHHIKLKDTVYVMFMTYDAQGRYKTNPSQLTQDINRAAKILGYTTIPVEPYYCGYMGFPDQGLDTIRLTDLNQLIEKNISNYEIDIVYTHHYGDINKDHRLTYEATITACRPTPECRIKGLYTYWVPSSSEWMSYDDNNSFKPNLIIEATKIQLDNKIEAMKTYSSELRNYPHPRSVEGLKIVTESFGLQFGRKFVETFQQLYCRV